MVRVLRRIGLRIDYPEGQLCCGQSFFKSGHWKKAIPLAKNTIQAFRASKVVVVPSGSCVNMIRHHYGELLREDPGWSQKAQELSEKVYEFSEFLINVMEADDLGSTFRERVTYHDSCQVLRGLGIASEPRQLLGKVRGLEFVEMEHPDICCGFGGVFSFKFPHVADAMVGEKVSRICDCGAGVVTGCEISCLMHIGGYLKHQRIPIRAMHLADVLA